MQSTRKKILLFLAIAACLDLSARQKKVISGTLFSHGLASKGEKGKFYHIKSGHANAFIQHELHVFDYADVNDIRSSCLGQAADMECLHNACKKHKKVSLLGVSRGAATILNYLAKYKPKNIDVVIVESPFDHVDSVVEHKAGGWGKSLLPASFPNYDCKGAQPITSIKKINRKLPILLVCSEKDTLIPAASTIRLYNAFRKAGYKHVYLLVTKHGPHAKILHKKDGIIYRNVVHAFYKRYNRPHNPQWAAAGEERFASCQPSLAEKSTSSLKKSTWWSRK